MRLYGLTAEQLDKLTAAGSTCAICGVRVDNPKSLHVDHDHKTGSIRGLICANCNAVVGMIEAGYLIDLAAIFRYLDGGHMNLTPEKQKSQPEPAEITDTAGQEWLF
jgi:hypothetical protein